MKFLLIVLAFHFVIELFSNKGKNKKDEGEVQVENVLHPAEYNLREEFYRIDWWF